MSARSHLRRALAATAVAVAASIALAGCTPPAESGAPAGGADTASAELVWAIEGGNLSDGHMDPQISQVDSSSMVQRALLDSLVWQEPDGTFSPWLATTWSVSDDGLSYTFELRDDVTFSDGTPFNAEAVKANFDRIIAPETASAQAAAMLGGDNYAGTTVVDEFTVRVDFAAPYAAFLQAASTANLGFWSPAAIAASGDVMKAGGPDANIGSGPFVMQSYTPDQEIVYTANHDYAWGPHGQGAPQIETLRVEIVAEPSVRTGMLDSGEAQLVSQLPPAELEGLDPTFVTAVKGYPGLPYSLFLNEGFGVFGDKRVRQAFASAIDIDSIVAGVFNGRLERAWSILGPTMGDYDASLEGAWGYDVDRANELLDEAGWTERDDDGIRMKDGKRLQASWIAWTPVSDDNAAIANAVQSDLKKVGFDIQRNVQEPAGYNELYGPREFDITDWDFSNGDPDFLRSHLATGGFQNASQISDPQVDEWIAQGSESSDPAVRRDVYTKLQQWNLEETAIVPIFVPAQISVSAPQVSGLEFDTYGRPVFYDVTLD